LALLRVARLVQRGVEQPKTSVLDGVIAAAGAAPAFHPKKVLRLLYLVGENGQLGNAQHFSFQFRERSFPEARSSGNCRNVSAIGFDGTDVTAAEFELLVNQSVELFGPVFSANDPDLSAFRDRGGKVIILHGLIRVPI